MAQVCLAATIHDPAGALAPAIAQAESALRETFCAVALNISDATAPTVIAAARTHLHATIITHKQGEAGIGRARRDAVALALQAPAPHILYSDFDHILRWLKAKPEELRATLAAEPDVDLLVVGRSPTAFATEPKRLQETEKLVNHAYALLTGRAYDLMFAVRRLSRRAAQALARDAKIDTVANDVEWPLLLERAGFTLGYAQADGLYYRTMEEFGAPADTGDGSALQWIRRIEYAALHAAVLRGYLEP